MHESLGEPWHLQAREGRRMGLRYFFWGELERSLPPLVSFFPMFQAELIRQIRTFFPKSVSGASHLGKGLSRDLCLCSHGWGEVSFPQSSARCSSSVTSEGAAMLSPFWGAFVVLVFLPGWELEQGPAKP